MPFYTVYFKDDAADDKYGVYFAKSKESVLRYLSSYHKNMEIENILIGRLKLALKRRGMSFPSNRELKAGVRDFGAYRII